MRLPLGLVIFRRRKTKFLRLRADHSSEPREVAPPPSPRKNWSRKEIAHWLVERLSEAPTWLALTTAFRSRSDISRSTICPTTGRSSEKIFKSIGPQTRTTRTWTSFVKASVETARPAVEILAGDGSRKYGQALSDLCDFCRSGPPLWLPLLRGCSAEDSKDWQPYSSPLLSQGSGFWLL